MKKVSVIITTYNYAGFIPEALEGALNQTYSNLEIIVIDDGSVDNTREVLKPYLDKINYIFKKNGGPASARNVGIKEATGEYFAFLDADDRWMPEKLNKSINFLEINNFDWICTSRFKITDDGKYTERCIEKESGIYNLYTGELEHLEIGLFNPNYVLAISSTVVIKKTCFDAIGLFDESQLVGEDLDLWLRFKEVGLKGGYLNEPLTICRSHKTSLSRSAGERGIKENIKIARKHARILHIDIPLRGKLYAEFWWEVALTYYLKNKKILATKYALFSFYFYPSFKKINKILKYGINFLFNN